MSIVVVDSNVLAASPGLRRPEWLSLVEKKHDWSVRIVVPEVVLMETVNVVRRLWAEERDRVASLKVRQFGLAEAQDSMLASIDRHSEGYEQWLRGHLDQIGVFVVPPPQVDLMELARRSSAKLAPYRKDKDKDCLRDTLIWFTVMAVAHENADEEVWFVSDNHQDFGPVAGNWTGVKTGERDDCPILFHHDLMADLDDGDLSGRVHYVVSVKRLEQHFAARFAPIADADLAGLVDRIDVGMLAERLVEAAWGLDLSPRQAALPLQAVAARIADAREQREGWSFSEGAGRGETRCTARFVVDTEIDIALVREDLTGETETKQLRLFGDVTVSMDGELQDLVVTSAEALPDDPMRPRWDGLAGVAFTRQDRQGWTLADAIANRELQYRPPVTGQFARLSTQLTSTVANVQADTSATFRAELAANVSESTINDVFAKATGIDYLMGPSGSPARRPQSGSGAGLRLLTGNDSRSHNPANAESEE
ncbi:PIN domain-containing protein [Nocardia sp. CA2R105]|uniref:PIN domain-containing protein n=1 Tax=Nocardia coffeae TaxID=2873381 RepID=UPI001CA76936|nr:PIN domain-containing protein [Nocardia coffeae]MBY8863976.1 PIN domain-containing protein [Nocardia coffeae]